MNKILFILIISIGSLLAFEPIDISGIQIWITSKNLITYGSGSHVSYLGDLSGNDRYFYQLTEDNQPTIVESGSACGQSLYFDGNDFLRCVDTSWFNNYDSITVIMRYEKQYHPDLYGVVFGIRGLVTQDLLLEISYRSPVVYHTVGLRRLNSDSYSKFDVNSSHQDSTVIVVHRHDYSNAQTFVKSIEMNSLYTNTGSDLTFGTSGSTSESTNITIGRSPRFDGVYFKGYIDEIIVYNKFLTDAERDSIFEYLNGCTVYDEPPVNIQCDTLTW